MVTHIKHHFFQNNVPKTAYSGFSSKLQDDDCIHYYVTI